MKEIFCDRCKREIKERESYAHVEVILPSIIIVGKPYLLLNDEKDFCRECYLEIVKGKI